jgi:hypothetical protein
MLVCFTWAPTQKIVNIWEYVWSYNQILLKFETFLINFLQILGPHFFQLTSVETSGQCLKMCPKYYSISFSPNPQINLSP